MSGREAWVSAARVWRRPARLLVVLALILTAASAAGKVAAGNASGDRTTSNAVKRTATRIVNHDHAAATSPHAPRENHRTGLRIGATLALVASALLLAWTTRRTRARQSLLWRALHGYVPRRGPPRLRLT
jgi:hypothetical protein